MTRNARPSSRSALTPSATSLHRVDVEAGIGLVEDAHARLEHGHLQDLVALLLAAREADVDRALEHLGVDVELARLLADQLEEVGGADLVLAARLALGVERGAQEGHVADARDLDRVLERQEQARRRPLLGLHAEQVVAVERRGAVRDHVAVAPGQDVGQRRLARAVRAHDGVHAAGGDVEVDALEDLLVLLLELHVQVADLKHLSSQSLCGAAGRSQGRPMFCRTSS